MTTITQKPEQPKYYTPPADAQDTKNHPKAIAGHNEILKKEQELQASRAKGASAIKHVPDATKKQEAPK